jgi:group I intron endonuclease
MKEAIVYITTNLINGKKYIGSHNNNNPYYLGSGKYFKQAFKKYGRENFIREILWTGPIEFMREMEEYYIDYYGAAKSSLFYNVSNKGTGVIIGTKFSEERKAKMSASMKGLHRSEEFKKKISKLNTGRKHSEEASAKKSAAMKGKKFSDETKAKMSAAKKGVKRGPYKIQP